MPPLLGLWLKIAKRGADEASVTYPEAVEIALCWGWIDGQKKSLDAQHFLQRFTPRRARSVWSKVNVEKVAGLIEAGRMQAPGLAQVEAAKADGRWARAYDGARTAVVPEDLMAALDAAPEAKAFFSTLNASNRYAVLWRIQTAVKPETRARRVAQLVEMLGRGGAHSHLQAQGQGRGLNGACGSLFEFGWILCSVRSRSRPAGLFTVGIRNLTFGLASTTGLNGR